MILVTGATGTIGSATVQALKDKGVKFKVGARSPDKLKGQGVEVVAFDWDKPETYGPALKGVEKVFLLPPTTDKQVEYTKKLVEEAKKAGVKHIVKLSVIGADAKPGMMLGRQHLAGEEVIQASGMTWTMLRPTFFMDNFVNYYGVDPKKDSTMYAAYGDSKACWVDSQDLGEVAAAALTDKKHEGKVYDLTGPEPLSAAEVLAILGQTFGHKYTYVAIPEEAARKGMQDMHMPGWLVEGYVELAAIIRNDWASTPATGVKDALGRPARSFQQYAKDAASAKS